MSKYGLRHVVVSNECLGLSWIFTHFFDPLNLIASFFAALGWVNKWHKVFKQWIWSAPQLITWQPYNFGYYLNNILRANFLNGLDENVCKQWTILHFPFTIKSCQKHFISCGHCKNIDQKAISCIFPSIRYYGHTCFNPWSLMGCMETSTWLTFLSNKVVYTS